MNEKETEQHKLECLARFVASQPKAWRDNYFKRVEIMKGKAFRDKVYDMAFKVYLEKRKEK